MGVMCMIPWASLLNAETQANICVKKEQQQLPPPRSLLMVYFRHSSEDTRTHTTRHEDHCLGRTMSSKISTPYMKGKAERGVETNGGSRDGGEGRRLNTQPLWVDGRRHQKHFLPCVASECNMWLKVESLEKLQHSLPWCVTLSGKMYLKNKTSVHPCGSLDH